MSAPKPRTLFDKIWDAHVVETLPDGTALLYIDLHLTHEVTTPQAFDGLRAAGRELRRPDATLGVIDHNIATDASRYTGIVDPESRAAGRDAGEERRRIRHAADPAAR